jgi:fructokinase
MIVVAGEALVDLAPRGEQLLPLPGGSPYNVGIGLGRLGVRTSYLGALSTDGFGNRLAHRLTAEDVAIDLAPRTDAPTTLAVVHLDADGRASYGFYLDGTSAVALDAQALPELPAGASLHVSLGAIGLTSAGTGRALARLITGPSSQRFTSLDPNVRPVVFDVAGGRQRYRAELDVAVGACDLVKVSDEDLETLAEDGDAMALARHWAERGPVAVVVTRGPDGAVVVRADRADIAVEGERVEVVDTVGAGDAFTSGLLAWLDEHDLADRERLAALDDASWATALRFARTVAAITCTRAGSDPPRRDELP